MVEYELRRAGYKYCYRFRQSMDRWVIRARRYPPLSPLGLRERPIEIRTREELARHLRS